MASVFVFPYSVMEKIQVTAFSIQEFIISSLYLYQTYRLLQPSATFQKTRTRRVMWHLIYVNLIIILMDITLLCTEYADLYEIQTTFKGAVYSVKLRLEFAVLNQLVSLTTRNSTAIFDGNLSSVVSHTATRGVPPETINDQIHPTPCQANTKAPMTYTVFAGRAIISPVPTSIDDNCVMKTTEVTVNSELVPRQGREQ